MARKFLSIHSDFYSELRNISSERRSDLLLALINWAEDGEPPQLDTECAILFRLMTAQIERISGTNSDNGKKGGAPIGNRNASKTSETSERPQNKRNKRNKRNKPTITVPITDTTTTTDAITGEANASCPASPTTDEPRPESRTAVIQEIVAFLNLTIGANYKPSGAKTREKITARLNEGYTLGDFKTVILKKHAEWRNDPAMSKFLRPETLFGPKFESYLYQPEVLPKHSHPEDGTAHPDGGAWMNGKQMLGVNPWK